MAPPAGALRALARGAGAAARVRRFSTPAAAPAAGAQPLTDHPMRREVSGLLQARPFLRVPIPALVSSVTLSAKRVVVDQDGVACPLGASRRPTRRGEEHGRIVGDESVSVAQQAARARAHGASAGAGYAEDYAHLRALWEHFGAPPPPRAASFAQLDLGACRVQWERNTEVQTYTFLTPAGQEALRAPFARGNAPVFSGAPEAWLRGMPGAVTSAVHVLLADAPVPLPLGDGDDGDDGGGGGGGGHRARQDRERTAAAFASVSAHFSGSDYVTAAALGRRSNFRVYSDFRINEDDGFVRMVVHAAPTEESEAHRRTKAGRVVQRLIEIDKLRGRVHQLMLSVRCRSSLSYTRALTYTRPPYASPPFYY